MARTNITLKFLPQYNINYHKRVACIIQNHEPLFIDLIGTCHSDIEKPAVLLKTHVNKFRVHMERGFTTIPPDEINKMLEDRVLTIDSEGFITDLRKVNIKIQ